MWPAVRREKDPKIIMDEYEEHELNRTDERTIYTYTGYPLIPFREFKKTALEKVASNIYNEFRTHLRGRVDPREFQEFAKLAAEAAEKIVEEKKRRAGGSGFAPIDGDLEKIPEVVQIVRMIKQMMPPEYIGPPPAPKKFPEVQKQVERELAAELLAIAKGLEFAGYSEDAMKKAEEELLKLIDELLENEANAFQLFHAVRLLRLVQKRDRNGIKKFGG